MMMTKDGLPIAWQPFQTYMYVTMDGETAVSIPCPRSRPLASIDRRVKGMAVLLVRDRETHSGSRRRLMKAPMVDIIHLIHCLNVLIYD